MSFRRSIRSWTVLFVVCVWGAWVVGQEPEGGLSDDLAELQALRRERAAAELAILQERARLEAELAAAKHRGQLLDEQMATMRAHVKRQQAALKATEPGPDSATLLARLREDAAKRLEAPDLRLLPDDQREALRELVADTQQAPADWIAAYCRWLSQAAHSGRDVEWRRAAPTVDGESRQAWILRLGTVLEFALLDDGAALMRSSQDADWESAPPRLATELRRARQMQQRRVPPDLVLVPVPRAALDLDAEAGTTIADSPEQEDGK